MRHLINPSTGIDFKQNDSLIYVKQKFKSIETNGDSNLSVYLQSTISFANIRVIVKLVGYYIFFYLQL